MDRTFAVAIGGPAGQGVATPGDIFAKLFARRGLHINACNACVTYNHDNTYASFRERVQKLEDDPSYDSSDWHEAMKRASSGRRNPNREILSANGLAFT